MYEINLPTLMLVVWDAKNVPCPQFLVFDSFKAAEIARKNMEARNIAGFNIIPMYEVAE